jgi:hypothetical protein
MADVEMAEEVEASTDVADPTDVPSADSAIAPEQASVPIAQPEPATVSTPEVRKPRGGQRTPRTESGLTHVVLRSFVGAGQERYPGEVVDASAWHAQRLVDGRRLRAITIDDPKPLEADGRFFINDDALIAYAESVIEAATQPDDESEED